MAVKAQWPQGQVSRPDGDPFADADDVAVRDPYEQLKQLVDAETALLNRGVSCAVRDREDTSCCACPKRGRIPELVALCDVGVRAERLVTELACARLLDGEAPLVNREIAG